MTTLKMNEDEIRDYIDSAIIMWRETRRGAGDDETADTAACYVDAYQSMRMSLFGEVLR